MKLQFGPFLVIVALLSAPLAWSQSGSNDSPQSSPAEPAQPPAAVGPQPVFTHPEDRPPFALLGEITEHNYINVGLGLTTAWDSNAAAFSYERFSQTTFTFSPSLQLTQTRPTLTWSVGAYGGLTTSTIPGYYNTSNPSASGGFLWQINHHWQLSASDNYLYSFDPFQQYLVLSSAPTFNQPNPTVYVPLTTTEGNYGNVDLTYQINSRDSLTFTGIESFRRYLHNTYSVYNLYSWGGVGVYQHMFSSRLSVGGAYSFTTLDFGHGQSRSGISNIQVFARYLLGPNMYVSGWVGPEYTATKQLVPVLCDPYGCYYEIAHPASWDSSFGGNFGWNGQRNAFSVGGRKAVSDGGILLGVVQLYQFNANFVRQLNPRWAFNTGVLYGNNTGYNTGFRHLNSFTGNAGFNRQLTPTLSASLMYLRYWETQQNLIGASAPKWTDNRIQFTLQYLWGHSLGR